jgi:hypothetical protein
MLSALLLALILKKKKFVKNTMALETLASHLFGILLKKTQETFTVPTVQYGESFKIVTGTGTGTCTC